ncbi:MAG: amidohydrolase [Sphingobacteriales bacterium]|nr:MAG: amidohydrolase [Sphingobacteriales bacterium]TAF78273.1 MAG: amidohydrolase [Sphingobacteriales bacterium]
MNVDVSPNGKEIVFDLLGDIYKMPVSGGQASVLSSGMAYDVQPRFSPNGKYISYTSDKDGADNIWVMNSNGGDKHAITKENFRLLNNAVWLPNSNYIIARKHFTGKRSLGAGELWMYHVSGGLDGVQLTKRKNDQQDQGEPWLSPDGKYVYFSEDVTPGSVFKYNKNPNTEIYAIKKLNLEIGGFEKIAGGYGSAFRPQISPNGKLLAFVKRIRLKTVLCVQNLHTGEEFPVYDDLSKDQQETWAIFGVYPNFNWLPDNKTIVFYAKGKIRKVNIDTQESAEIPFSVDVKQNIVDALHYDQKVFTDEFEAKMIRQLVTSPDGKKIIFNAAGYLYQKLLPNGKPERLTHHTDWEFEPSFSNDGKYLVYTTWNDATKSSIVKYNFDTKDTSILSHESGYYFSPKFSNKGDMVVYTKGVGNPNLGYVYGKNAGLYTVSAKGGVPKFIVKTGSNPQFNTADSRIFFITHTEDKSEFKSCDLNGQQVQTHYTSNYANSYCPSPDNKWMAFTELFNVYVTPMVTLGNSLDLASSNKTLPLKKISTDAGNCIQWSSDSKNIHYILGPKYFTKTLKNTFNNLSEVADNLPQKDTTTIHIGLKIKSDIPTGKLAFTNVRIITMNNNEVIENGTILVDENRIAAIGKTNEVNVPADALLYNMEGKTIMPGIIDVHAHLPTSNNGVSPQQEWPYFANLAFGVTTCHDPSSNTEMAFSQAEMIKAGRLTGPRLYSTGTILYGADGDFKAVINSYEDALSHLKRMKAVGAFTVKSYNQPRREQRQQIIEAARQLKMEVMPEGGSTFFTNMSMIADGHTGIEHNIPVTPVYKDVTNFWNASKTAYTPTLIVSYGSQWGENFWYDRSNVWDNDKLLNFVPRQMVDARSRRRNTSEYGDYGHIEVSKAVTQIAAGGTKINLGAHGQLQGLGAHWELWMLVQGGMNNLDALKCATINGADYLGMDKEIGSLVKGKLADFIVLDANPLDDIRNSEKIKYTIANGRIYDAENMNELGNHLKIRAKFWWQIEKLENMMDEDNNQLMHGFDIVDED